MPRLAFLAVSPEWRREGAALALVKCIHLWPVLSIASHRCAGIAEYELRGIQVRQSMSSEVL